MGPLLLGLIAPLIAALKQKAVAYSIMAAGGLVALFAAAYALDAIHVLLMFRYGAFAASLSIAGLLLLVAGIMVGVAQYIGRQTRDVTSTPLSSPYSNPPSRPPVSRQRLTAIAAAVAGAVTSGAAIAGSKRLRRWLSGRPSGPIDPPSPR